MKFPVLWSGLCCYTEGWGGKCSEILATIKLLYNPRVNKVFTHSQLLYITMKLAWMDCVKCFSVVVVIVVIAVVFS